MSSVTVIGAGRMGSAMALRIAAAGHAVTVWNRSEGPLTALSGVNGVVVTRSLAQSVSSAEFVISSLSSGGATEAVLLDPQCSGALRSDAVVCDMGTSGLSTALALKAGLTPIRFIDCPVSGSVPSVVSGQLLVMASGDVSAITSIQPVLSAFAKRVIRVGDVGAGQSMKLSVNLIVHALNSAVAEGLALAVRSGIEPAEAYEVFENSSIAAPYVVYKKSAFLAESASVAMSLDLVNKDLGLIEAAAQSARLRTPVLDGVHTEVSEACQAGRGANDMSDLIHHILGSGDTPNLGIRS